MWQIFNRSHVHECKKKPKNVRVTANLCTELKNVNFNVVWQFLLIPQWNGEQDTSRSMPGSDLQLFSTFFEDEFFDSVFFKVPENWRTNAFLREIPNRHDARKSYWKSDARLSPDFYIYKKRAPVSRIRPSTTGTSLRHRHSHHKSPTKNGWRYDHRHKFVT